MPYFIGYNSQIHKYVLMDYDFNNVGEFESAKDLFEYCENNGYKYTFL